MLGFIDGIKMNRCRVAIVVLGAVLAVPLSSVALPKDNVFVDREARIETRIHNATKEKDIILLNCLVDRLIELKNLHRIGIDSLALAAAAAKQENLDLEEHYSTKMKIVEAESLRVFTEASLCVGTPSDKTVVRMVVISTAPAVPEQASPPAPGNTRPPDASPFD